MSRLWRNTKFVGAVVLGAVGGIAFIGLTWFYLLMIWAIVTP